MGIIFNILLVLFLVLLNGFFVASEFALVSVRKTRVVELAKKGNKNAQDLQMALENLNLYISSTQLGITLASLALGWVGEPAIANMLVPLFTFLPNPINIISTHTIAVIIAFSLITFLLIVVGELVPKSIAIQRAEAASFIIIKPLIIFTQIFKPVIWLLNKVGEVLTQSLGFSARSEKESFHSEEEVKMILTESSLSGVIPEEDVEMVYNVFQFGDTTVKEIMVPRNSILAFNIDSDLKNVDAKVENRPHSRFPVYENTIDNIIGFIHIKDIYRELLQNGEQTPLSKIKIIRKIINVGENKKLNDVLEEMQRKRTHLAVVINQHHKTVGIITMEDVIESLVGEIEDEFN